jgi:hypothetical protein
MLFVISHLNALNFIFLGHFVFHNILIYRHIIDFHRINVRQMQC